MTALIAIRIRNDLRLFLVVVNSGVADHPSSLDRSKRPGAHRQEDKSQGTGLALFTMERTW